jgi:hypothetical protein
MKTEKLNRYPIILPKKKAFIITPEQEIRLHCCAVVAGARGSGKSISVSSKLHHLKKQGLADRILMISPTYASNVEIWKDLVDEDDVFEEMDNSSVQKVIDIVEAEAKEWFQYEKQIELWKKWKQLMKRDKPIENIDPKLMIEFLEYGIIDMEENGLEPQSKYGHRPVLHLICDDCQSSKLFVPSTKNKLLNATIRHRHLGFGLGLSMWFLVQNYSTNSGVPRSIRDNSTVLILFPMKNSNSIVKVIQEVGGNIDEETFNKVYHEATHDDPHNFLVIEFSPNKKKYTFRKCWDTILIPEELPKETNEN